MVELLTASGDLIGEPRPITHPVKFYERGDRPLEIVTSRQWFLRNGGRDDPLRGPCSQRRPEVEWHPPTWTSVTRTGSTGSTAIGWSAASGSRRPRPGLVPG